MANPNDPSKGFDSRKAEVFANQLLGALNSAGLCLMASIGHRAGLFDVMRGRPASTSEEIARAAGLNERYVREWLGAMVTSKVVETSPASDRYRLPDEHAAFLTRAAGADNIGIHLQYVGTLGSVEDDILACFYEGGGIPYAKFPRFHAIMAEDQTILAQLESKVLPLIPDVAERLKQGIRVLDAGCGRGRVLIRLAELFPRSRFVGMDLSKEAIAEARDEAATKGVTNISFEVRDLSDFDSKAEPDSFDLVTTFDAVHDQAEPLRLLKGIHRTLVSGGTYLMQDIKASTHPHENIEHPLGTFLYTVSCMHCMTVSLAQGGEGLGAMWGEEKTLEYLARAGFGAVETHAVPNDINNNWYVVRK
jgi:ubiquinone/menaquinone biosynthesis C-methylase UbiE